MTGIMMLVLCGLIAYALVCFGILGVSRIGPQSAATTEKRQLKKTIRKLETQIDKPEGG